MKKLIIGLIGAGLAVSLLLIPLLASGHSTGEELRSPDQCMYLPVPGDRDQCASCVTRPSPHHYHPYYPNGTRCQPNVLNHWRPY